MRIDERRVGNVTILDLNGRLTWPDGHDHLRRTIKRLVGRGQANLVLNLRGVSSVDCAGLGVVAGQLLAVRRVGGHLKLLSLPRAVRHLFAVCKLVDVIDVYELEPGVVLSFQPRV